MRLVVKKLLSEERIILDVNISDSVDSVKQIIQNIKGIPFNKLQLVFEMNLLENGQTLAYYHLKDGYAIYYFIE